MPSRFFECLRNQEETLINQLFTPEQAERCVGNLVTLFNLYENSPAELRTKTDYYEATAQSTQCEIFGISSKKITGEPNDNDRINEDVLAAGENYLMVCDGLTGHNRNNQSMLMGYAVREVTHELANSLLQQPATTDSAELIRTTLSTIPKLACTMLRQALQKQSDPQYDLRNICTTADIALCHQARIGLLHIGDGSIHRGNGDSLHQIEQQHTNYDGTINSVIGLQHHSGLKQILVFDAVPGNKIFLATDGMRKGAHYSNFFNVQLHDDYVKGLPLQAIIKNQHQSAINRQNSSRRFDDVTIGGMEIL